MSRFTLILSTCLAGLVALSFSTASEAHLSVFIGFPQTQVFVPSQMYVNCYKQRYVGRHGRLYTTRVCQRSVMPVRTMWAGEDMPYYHMHHHYWY